MPSDWRLVRSIRGNARAVALRLTIFVNEIQLDPGPSRRVAQKCYSVDIGGNATVDDQIKGGQCGKGSYPENLLQVG